MVPSRADSMCADIMSGGASERNSASHYITQRGVFFSGRKQLRGEAVEIVQAAIGMAGGEQCVLISRTVKDLVVGAGFTFERRGVVASGKELWEFFQVRAQMAQ